MRRDDVGRYVLIAMLMGVLVPGRVEAQSDAEEAQLKNMQQVIDTDLAGETHEISRIGELAEQFQVPATRIQGLRDKKQGWGEITTELALAQQLAKTDSKTYPSTTDALSRIESLRQEGKGWGKLAQELGIELGPVISRVKETRETFQGAHPASHSGRGNVASPIIHKARSEFEVPPGRSGAGAALRSESLSRPEQPGHGPR